MEKRIFSTKKGLDISSSNDPYHRLKNNLSSLRFSLKLLSYDLEAKKKERITQNIIHILDKALLSIEELSLYEKFKKERLFAQNFIDLCQLLQNACEKSSCVEKVPIITNRFWLKKILTSLCKEYPMATLLQKRPPLLALSKEKATQEQLFELFGQSHSYNGTPLTQMLHQLGSRVFKHENVLFIQFPLFSRQLKIATVIALSIIVVGMLYESFYYH